MAVQYTVRISDEDYKALCYMHSDPSTYVDNQVTEYIRLMKEDIARQLIKKEFEKSSTRTIPATIDEIIEVAELKPVSVWMAEDAERMERMMANPDDAPEAPESVNIPD